MVDRSVAERRLPRWLWRLQCTEGFVYQPATLKSISCAMILSENLIKGEDAEYIWKLMGKETVEIVSEDHRTENFRGLFRTYIKANEVSDYYKQNLKYAWGYSDYDVVDKSQINFAVELEAKAERKHNAKKAVKRLFSD